MILHVTYCHMIFLEAFFRNKDVTMRQLSAVSCPAKLTHTGLPDPCLDRPCSLIPSWPSLPPALIPASSIRNFCLVWDFGILPVYLYLSVVRCAARIYDANVLSFLSSKKMTAKMN